MTEPYNAGLAANQLIEDCSAVFCVDNEVTLTILETRRIMLCFVGPI